MSSDSIYRWAMGEDIPGIEDILKSNRGLQVHLPNGVWLVEPSFCGDCAPPFHTFRGFGRYHLYDRCPNRNRYDHKLTLKKVDADGVAIDLNFTSNWRKYFASKNWPWLLFYERWL